MEASGVRFTLLDIDFCTIVVVVLSSFFSVVFEVTLKPQMKSSHLRGYILIEIMYNEN